MKSEKENIILVIKKVRNKQMTIRESNDTDNSVIY